MFHSKTTNTASTFRCCLNNQRKEYLILALILTALLKVNNAQPIESLNRNYVREGSAREKQFMQENCEYFSFVARLDAYPSEFGITLEQVADIASTDVTKTIWRAEDHQYMAENSYKTVRDSVCLLPNECYRLTVLDSDRFQDG
jgi:hypothetical protein